MTPFGVRRSLAGPEKDATGAGYRDVAGRLCALAALCAVVFGVVGRAEAAPSPSLVGTWAI